MQHKRSFSSPPLATGPSVISVLSLSLTLTACGLPDLPKHTQERVGREDYVDPAVAASRSDAKSTSSTSTAAGATAQPPAADSPPSCDAHFDPPVRGGVTAELVCGGHVAASTEGGTSSFGDDFYQHAFCSPERAHYDDAPEAVYKLKLPPNTRATITLQSPCADLDVVAMSWVADSLPTVDEVGRVRECEMDTKTGGGKLTLTSVKNPQTYLIAVDGKQGDAAPFRLDITCGSYR